MKITIYGYGYVGRAMGNLLKDHYELQIVDPNFSGEIPEGATVVANAEGEAFEKTKHAIICVPTPMREDGSCDISIVEEILLKRPHEFFLIKSTIPPGTTVSLRKNISDTDKKIAFSPEYIGEGKYVVPWWKDRGYPHPTDMKYHDFQIFGGLPLSRKEWIKIFQRVLGPSVKYIQTDSTTAELVKYVENLWGATKVTFFNEIYDACTAFGVDYNELRELFLLDGRTERMHTSVFPDKRGFSGKCYPKDMRAFIEACRKIGYDPKLVKSIWNRNIEFVLSHGKDAHGNPEWASESSKYPQNDHE